MALTGGIGSGKSEALAAFAACGAATWSADAAVHAAYGEPDVVARVRERFGDGVLGPGGTIDRALLGALALAQEGGLAALEAILHPLVGRGREQWIAARRAEAPPPPLLVCEIPILFEAGTAGLFDAVLVVTASDAVRRARVAARGQDFDTRAARQMSEREKVERADAAFVNDDGLDELRGWVADRFAQYAGQPCNAPSADH